MPAEIRDLSPLCSTCGYKEANPCSHCTLSLQIFLYFSVFKLAKDEVTMLQWMMHWEFMFWKLFPFAYLLAFCQVLVPFNPTTFPQLFFCLPHPVPASLPQHLFILWQLRWLLFSIAPRLLLPPYLLKISWLEQVNRIPKHLFCYHKAIYATDSANGLRKL